MEVFDKKGAQRVRLYDDLFLVTRGNTSSDNKRHILEIYMISK